MKTQMLSSSVKIPKPFGSSILFMLRGNCRGRQNLIDIKKESKALPKRRRQRNKPGLLSRNKENAEISPEDEGQPMITMVSA